MKKDKIAVLIAAHLGLALCGILVACGQPIAGVLALVVVAAAPLCIRIGIVTTAVCVAILLYGAVGAIGLYVPAVSPFVQVSLIGLSAVGAFWGLRFATQTKLRGIAPKLAAVYVFCCALATVVSVFGSGTTFGLRSGLALVFPLLCAFAVAGTISSSPTDYGRNQRRIAIVATVIVVVMGNSAFSLRQATVGFTGAEVAKITAGISTYGVGDTIRTMGLLPTNQDFGLLAACLTPALIMSAALTRGWHKTWLLVAGVTLGVAMALSLTRTSLIAAVISLVLALALWGNGHFMKRIAKYGSIAIFSAIALVVLVQSSGNERVMAAVDRALTLTDLTADRSFNDRLRIVYPRAIQAMIENPFGAGSGSAGPMSQIRPDLAPLGEMTTDNGFLMVGVQIGWIGMVAFFALLMSTMFWLEKKNTFYAVSAATAILALMIAMITAQYWTLTAPICVIAAWVGLGISSTNKTADPARLVKTREKLLLIK